MLLHVGIKTVAFATLFGLQITGQSKERRARKSMRRAEKRSESDSFYSDGPINDLMAFLRLIVYPEESNSYAQILQSPFTNLSIPESLAILSEKKAAFEKLDNDILKGKSLEIYQKTGDFYRNLVNSAKFESISTIITRLWYEIGYRYETLWNHTVEMYVLST